MLRWAADLILAFGAVRLAPARTPAALLTLPGTNLILPAMPLNFLPPGFDAMPPHRPANERFACIEPVIDAAC